MSFYVVFNCDGAPVDLHRLDHIKIKNSERNVETVGKTRQVAFGLANQRSDLPLGPISERAVIDQRYWLIGRVRLDAREELGAVLSLRTQTRLKDESDAVVCLHAYLHWGEQFLEHLRGDFCFVLWDEDRQRLL